MKDQIAEEKTTDGTDNTDTKRLFSDP